MKSDYSDIDTANIERGEVVYPTHTYVNDNGIWEPLSSYVKANESCNYKLLISKEVFIEAYNKFIRDDTSSNSGKKVIY